MVFSKLQKNSLDKFFYPKSIAVIGASDNNSKIGGYIFSEILKVKNITVYPINNKSSFVQGYQAYSTIKHTPKPPEMVIIVIPSPFVLETLIECISEGIKNIIIISAGFKETGNEGEKREEELKRLIRKNNVTLIGPNCLGILNVEIGLNCSFAKDIPKSGNIALISQSGAVIDAILDWSFKHNIGFSKVVSLGNMAGVDELEMLEYLRDDQKTSSIVFYMETLEKGEKFAKVLRTVTKKKPVIIINPGKSQNAIKAIGSHTGSLAKDSALVDTLLKENNAILVDNFNELFNILIGLKMKLPSGKSTTIVTNAGGPGVISTDCLAHSNLELTQFNEEQKESLQLNLPKEASVNNPIDVLGDAQQDRYQSTIKTLGTFENVDNILVLLTPQVMTNSLEIAKNLVSFNSKKTVISSFIGEKEVKTAKAYFDTHHFPNFETPNEAIKTLNKLYSYNTFEYNEEFVKYDFDQSKIKNIKEKISHNKGLLSYEFTKEILSLFAIEMPHKKVLTSVEQIMDAKLDNNKNYVLKIDGVVHKKDIGGVITGVTSTNFISHATKLFDKVLELDEGVITLEEEFKGSEVIVGLKSDEGLGNFIMFGMGGTYVSIFNDIQFASCPLSKERAKNLVKSSKVYKILKGYRGSKPINFEHLYEILIRISYLQEYFPEIKEVDLNPIICNEDNVYLVDVKLLV